MEARWDEATWERGGDLRAHAPPYDYNPSSWRERIPICVLAAVGCLISAYMALYQWGFLASVWDPVFGEGSERVLSSPEAHRLDKVLRVPDAAFGAWGFLSEAVFGLVGGTRRWQHRPWMVVIFGLDVIPLGLVSAALVVVQGAVVGSWCFLCLVTAAISITLVYLAYDEVWATLKYLKRVWRVTRDKRQVWEAFIGRPSAQADAVALQGGR